MENKPFIFGVATSGDNFTDRKVETARLLNNFQHGVNTVLISPRRWGKTSLVQKVSSLAASDALKIVYLDIFSCRSDSDFYDAFAQAVLKQTSSKVDEWLMNIKQFLSRVSPRLSFGTDPMNDVSLSLDLKNHSSDIDEILNLPEKIAREKGWNIVICIDEFQQIGEFGDSVTFQKRLRAVWQLQSRVSYCLFGSKKHLMNELFEKKSKPFYKFGDAIYLPKIATEDWVEYIIGRFEASGKSISAELAAEICSMVENHSSYVQQLSWLVWILTDKCATEDNLNEARRDLISQNTPLFERQTENLTGNQLNFLRAIVDGVDASFSSQKVIYKYNLGSSANICAVKRALVKKEIIETSNGITFIADPVMKLWLKQKFSSTAN